MQHLQNWLQDLTLIKLSSKSVLKLTKWIAQTLQTTNEAFLLKQLMRKKLFYLFSRHVDMESLWEGEGNFKPCSWKGLRWDPPWMSVQQATMIIYQKCPNFVKRRFLPFQSIFGDFRSKKYDGFWTFEMNLLILVKVFH